MDKGAKAGGDVGRGDGGVGLANDDINSKLSACISNSVVSINKASLCRGCCVTVGSITGDDDGEEDDGNVNVIDKCEGMFVKVLDVNAKR